MGCLYRLDFPNGKSYVGITSKTAEWRWKTHVQEAKQGKYLINLAIRKHGPESVKLTTLAQADDWAELCALERAAIIQHGTRSPHGYNVTDGGEGTPGLTHAPDARTRLRGAVVSQYKPVRRTAKVLSESHKANIGAAMAGRVFSDEHRARLSAAANNMSPQHRERISEGKRRWWALRKES